MGHLCQSMAEVAVLEEGVKSSLEEVTKQGDIVRSLKASVKDGKAEKVEGSAMCFWLLCLLSQAKISPFCSAVHSLRVCIA